MYEVGGFGYGEQPPPPPPRRGPGVLSYVAVAVAAGALGAGAVLAFGHVGGSNTAASSPAAVPSSSGIAAAPPNPQQSQGVGAGVGSGGSANEQAVYNKVSPGLVIINISQGYNAVQAAGTGMVLTANGEVLTNNHVIEDSTSISATVPATGATYQAKVVGYDKTGDIALIQLQNASGLRTVPIGDSSAVKNGAAIVAMGNAEGRNQIVPAAGNVTGINQTVTAQDESASQTETLHGMIETNADIVSGDSGGALANASGDVIGMNTAGNNGGNGFGYGGDQGQGSAGFAIPINTALSVVNQIKSGTATSTVSIGYPPFLGIFVSDSTSSSPQAQAQGMQSNGNGFGFGGSGYGSTCIQNSSQIGSLTTIANVSSGTLVEAVICGQPAALAGMTAGSVITAVNGQAVAGAPSLTTVVSRYSVGTTVSVTWVSPSGKTTTSSLKLIPGPPH